MATQVEHEAPKKRVLQKIRRQFINRTPEQDENSSNHQNTLTSYINPNKVFLIKSCVCLAEENGKICLDTHYLTAHLNVNHISIHDEEKSQIVTVNLALNPNSPNIPWDYIVKRLESFGDLDLATWAYRMKKHYMTYPKLMEDYFKLFKVADPNKLKKLKETRNRARAACQEIESKYPFQRLTAFSNEENTEMLSCAFSQSFLEELDYSVEDFVACTKENGLPALLDKECPVHLEIASKYLDGSALNNLLKKKYLDSVDYMTYFYNSKGQKKKKTVKFIVILEPTPEGVFINGYLILCDDEKKGELSKATEKSEADEDANANLKKFKE